MSWMIDFYSHRWKIAAIKLLTFSFKWTTYYICLSNGMKRIVRCQEFPLLFIVHDHTTYDMKLIGLMVAFVVSLLSKSFHVIPFHDNNAHTMPQCHWWAMKIHKIIKNQPKPKKMPIILQGEFFIFFPHNPLNSIMKREKNRKTILWKKWGQTIVLSDLVPSQFPTSFLQMQ